MPIVLLGIFAIVYISQFGVVSERAELALRYGGIAAFDTSSSEYSAASIYYNLSGQVPACPAAPVSIVQGAGPFPGPTSAPFWQPSADAPATSSCSGLPYGFGGSQFIASHYWGTTTLTVSAGVDVPPYLKPALGGNTGTATTTLTFIHAAYPGVILYCSTEIDNRVKAAVTANGSNPLPTPIPDGTDLSTPPPDNNGHCD